MSPVTEDAEQMICKSLTALCNHLVAKCSYHGVYQPDAVKDWPV